MSRRAACFGLVTASLLWLAATGAGAAPDDPPPPLTPAEHGQLADASAVGGLLHALDVRAAHATDLLLQAINPADHPDFVGWVARPEGRGFIVSFYERRKDSPAFDVMADVLFSPDAPVALTLAPERDPGAGELSMLRARLAALHAVGPSCTPNVNTVVLPSRDPATWDVYVLAATRRAGVMQVGGHTRVAVARGDSAVRQVEPLSRSCLVIDTRPPGLPDGATPSALSVSHVVSPLPGAIHSYLNLLHGMPLVVGTARGLFEVREGMITPLHGGAGARP